MSQLVKQSHASPGVPFWKSESAISGGSFTAEYPDIWGGVPPTTTDDAVNRLSMLLYARTVANGTLAETTPESKILIQTNTSGSDEVFVVKYTNAGTALWTARMGGTGLDQGLTITADLAGNVYAGGSYASNPITLFNADGSEFGTLANSGSGTDAFLVKYDPVGVVQWAVNIAGQGTPGEDARGLSIDGSGSVYMTGRYTSDTSFFNADGSLFTTLTGASGTEVYVVKYDVNGFGVWATRFASVGATDAGLSLTTDSGNVYVAGQFTGTMFLFNADTTEFGTLVGSGNTDGFAVKLTTDGFIQWAVRMGSTGVDSTNGVGVDTSGNVYLTGTFSGTTTFFNADTSSGGSLVSEGSSDAFVVKYSPVGVVVWATKIGGTGAEFGTGVGVDALGNVYAVGSYASNPVSIFNTGGSVFGTLPTAGGTDGYLVKYNTDGMAQWMTRLSGGGAGTQTDTVNAISVDSDGNCFLTGSTNTNPLMLFNSNGTLFSTLASLVGNDCFLVRYNTNGQGVWRTSINGTNNEVGNGIHTNPTGLCVIGTYTSVPLYIRSAGL